MKKFIIFCTLSIILISCGTSNHVVKDGLFQKRKYTAGWFIKKKGQSSGQEANSTDQVRKIKSEEPERNESVATLTKKANQRTAEGKEHTSYSAQQAEVYADVGSVKIEKKKTDVRPKDVGSFQKIDVAETMLSSNSVNVNDPYKEQNARSFLQLLDVKQLVAPQEEQHSEKSPTQSSEESSNNDLLFILTVALCFILPPLAVYIFTEDLTQTLLNLLLTLLFIIPGVVHALLVVFGKL